MIADSKFVAGESYSLIKKQEPLVSEEGSKTVILERDDNFETPRKEMADSLTLLSSPISDLRSLEEIQAKFWKEFNEIPNKFNADNTSLFLTEREETEKPRQKRKYVRKAKLIEESSEEEFEIKHKTFVVEENTTLGQLVDDVIIDVKRQ